MEQPDRRCNIVLAGSGRRFRFTPKSAVAFREGEAVDVSLVAMETHETRPVRATWRDGRLEMEIALEGEQEFLVRSGEKELGRLYSLHADLFERLPYKGDFHIHSNRSDGMLEPARVAAAARGLGMDFLAVTDHGQYQPSIEAIRAFDGYANRMLLLPGEEVHPPGNPVHMINFGGGFSINELFDDAYDREVAAIAASCGCPGEDAMIYAGCKWCFQKIDSAGGVSILCHPFWITRGRYNIKPELLDYLFANRDFAAFELLGGHESESNNLQVAYWQEKRANGVTTPIVGVSDAHETYAGGEYFGWTYTILFSESLSLKGIRDSVKNGYSVAVECLPGECSRVYGGYRLVKYAHFLLREYFPEHDRACAIDSCAMLEHLEKES